MMSTSILRRISESGLWTSSLPSGFGGSLRRYMGRLRDAHAISAGLFVVLAIALLGCSNKQIYNAVQENRRVECGKLPQNQYEQCMGEYDTPYEEYQREREAAIDSEVER